MRNRTGSDPAWFRTLNVAEIYPEEAVVKRELGSGNFGTVFIGVVQLHNGIR